MKLKCPHSGDKRIYHKSFKINSTSAKTSDKLMCERDEMSLNSNRFELIDFNILWPYFMTIYLVGYLFIALSSSS